MAAKKVVGLPETVLTVPEMLSQLVEIEPEMRDAMGGDVVCLWRQTPCMGMRVDGYKLGTLLDGKTQAYIPRALDPVLKPNGDRPLDDLVHPYKIAVGKSYDVGKEVSRCPVGQKAYSRVYHPLADVTCLEELEEWTYPIMDQQ